KFAGCLVIAVIVITGFAQNPAKPYTEWSEKEVKKALDNSPWAHSQIETDTSEMFYRPDAVTATGPNSSSDRATNGQTNQATSVNYHIRFLSALPVREAYARRIALDQKTPNPQLLSQLQGFVERDFSAYIVVTVSYDTKDPRFANAPNQAFAAALAATLKPTTYLERNDGKRLFLDDYKALHRTVSGRSLSSPALWMADRFSALRLRRCASILSCRRRSSSTSALKFRTCSTTASWNTNSTDYADYTEFKFGSS